MIYLLDLPNLTKHQLSLSIAGGMGLFLATQQRLTPNGITLTEQCTGLNPKNLDCVRTHASVLHHVPVNGSSRWRPGNMRACIFTLPYHCLQFSRFRLLPLVLFLTISWILMAVNPSTLITHWILQVVLTCFSLSFVVC